MPATSTLLVTSIYLSLTIAAAGQFEPAELSRGVWYLYGTPVVLIPHHAHLLIRAFGPATRLVLHALLLVFAAGTMFAFSNMVLVIMRGEGGCTQAESVCLGWAPVVVLALLQVVFGAAEAIVLGMLVWRARPGAIRLPGEDDKQLANIEGAQVRTALHGLAAARSDAHGGAAARCGSLVCALGRSVQERELCGAATITVFNQQYRRGGRVSAGGASRHQWRNIFRPRSAHWF
jgi:hypothetical protein